jgi:hypothetical protein
VTSFDNDLVRKEVAAHLRQSIDDGIVEGTDLHFFATQLLIDKCNRDVFATLETNEGRVSWLLRAFQRADKSN